MLKQIERAIFNKRTAKIIISKFKDFLLKKNEEINRTLKRLDKQIKEINTKQENLSDILADGIDRRQRDIVLSKLEKLEDEKIALQEYIAKEKSKLALEVPDEKELEQCFIKAQEMFTKRSLEEMQKLIDLYVEKIIVNEDEVQVILNFVPFVYRQDFTGESYFIKRSELTRDRKKEQKN